MIRLLQSIFMILLFLGVFACTKQKSVEEIKSQPLRVVSVDYCADQYVLKFVDKDRIAALSLDAGRDFSFMREAAIELPKVRSRAEDILAYQPDLIVRSYGGGPNATAYFERAGIPVVQIGWAGDLYSVKRVILETSQRLGAAQAGIDTVADMEARLAALSPQTVRPDTLYMTPGGVTSGSESLVHEMLMAAGLNNFEKKAGWHDLPLERFVTEQPDLIAFASFDSHVTPWSIARHPIARAQLRNVPVVELEGAWTSCGGWFLVDAIEALANGGS